MIFNFEVGEENFKDLLEIHDSKLSTDKGEKKKNHEHHKGK